MGSGAITIVLIFLLLLVLSLFVIQSFGQGWTLLAWMAVAGVAIIGASLLSVSSLERKANRTFRSGDYAKAVGLYEKLVEEKPLARNKAFLGAALGASERNEESVDLSTQAIEQDPEYGLAYYNRALVLQRMGKKSRVVKDLNRALEADLPRRFRSAARGMLEEMS